MKTSLISKLLISLIISLSLNNYAYGDDVVTPVDKGTPAPFDGVLFPNDKANDAKNAVIERDALKKLNLSLGNVITIQDNNLNLIQQKVDLANQQNDDLAKRVQDSQSTSDLTKVLWFAGGVLATGIAAFAIHSAIH